MSSHALTDERWSGLPLRECNLDPGHHFIDVATPILVIRDEPGSQCDVLSHTGQHASFRQAPLRFDLFGAGLEIDAVSDRPATRSLVVVLPRDWMPADESDGLGHVSLRSRFQFNDLPLRRLVWRLASHHRSGQPLGNSYNRAVSLTIVDRVARLQIAADARSARPSGLDARSRRYVQTRIDAELEAPPAVRDLARAVGLGVVPFVRAFKTSFEATPHQFIAQRRLHRARELLTTTDAPMAVVAMETGFANPSHFSTVFRLAMGMSPSRYRRAASRT